MERLTLSRRPKTGDKIECLPAGDGLPVWTTIPLDAKLPMMQNPKGSVILYTTKLGQPKHRSKQEHDFDLRDPNGKYISNEYHPLHDPHLKSYFSKEVMRRHLIKKGFISENGKVLCSLREFNQYRQYLRHIFFLEIAKERKEELERRGRTLTDDKVELRHRASRGTVVRRRLQQQRERDTIDLKKNLNLKAEKLEKRLQAIREEMIAREQKQREESEKRQMAVYRNQQEAEQRNQILIKRWRHKDRLRKRLIEDREAQRKIQAEMKCLEKWNERKQSQKDRLDRQTMILQLEDDHRVHSITERERFVNRQRESLQRKLDALKESTRERKRKRDELYAKRFEEKLASGDYTKWSRRREKRNKNRRPFNSTWALKDVLNNFTVPGGVPTSQRPTVPKSVQIVDVKYNKAMEDEELREKAREIVDGVIEKVKNEIYPAYLRSICEDDEQDATPSKSVRFSHEEDEIKPEISVTIEESKMEGVKFTVDDFNDDMKFRPVTEHILTPCASQLEVQKLEAEAILGSPEVGDKISSVSFVETLLLRLLDDLNGGRLKKEDIMKLASYSMEIIQSTETDTLKDATILEELESEGPLAASSSSSIIAKRLVDFTLTKILSDIQSGNVHHDDLASLTVSLIDISGGSGDEGSIALSVSEADLDDYIDETIRAATVSAMDPREDSPVCEALLDNFMVNTLRMLIKDLEQEALSKDQIESLAKCVKEETKVLRDTSGIELTSISDIRFVLDTLLSQMKSGDFDSQSLYQIVFAVVYSYNLIKHPPTPSYENKITELLKDVLFSAEEKASSGKLEIVNENVVHEAHDRLSSTRLDIGQIEKLSSSIINVSTKPDILCKTTTSEMAQSIIEDVLIKAKDQIEREQVDASLLEGVQNVAEAVILTLAPESQSPPLVDIFVEILDFLKTNMQHSTTMDKNTLNEFTDLMDKVKTQQFGPDVVAEMATSVAEIVKELPKSEDSEVAFYAIKDSLKAIRDDLRTDNIEKDLINEMIEVVKFAGKSAILSDPKSPGLLTCLAEFIRSVLNMLSLKLQTGELNEGDINDISKMLQEKLEAKTTKIDTGEEDNCQTKNEYTEVEDDMAVYPRAENVLEYLSYLIDNMETGGMSSDEMRNIGTKLIEYGRSFMKTIGESASSIATEDLAEGAVEEVLRVLKMEIESGVLTKDSLKDVTKSIIISSSVSDFADEMINGTLRGIERDLQRGYELKNIPSIPTADQSPSASTIASFVVTQTIDEIVRKFSKSGMPKEMMQSVASSLMSYLDEKGADVGNLPAKFEKHRTTVEHLVSVLKQDSINVMEAEKLFCLILKRYRDFNIGKTESRKNDTDLSDTDAGLVEDLVNETLMNIQRSVESGKLIDKDFSIPSAAASDDTSQIASAVVNLYLENIKQHQAEDQENLRPKMTESLIDFVIEIIEKLQTELSTGSISSLSMATFYRSISSEQEDIKSLEANATDNLALILFDIETNRSKSVFVQRIIDTYFTEDQYSVEALGDSAKAVESILVSVSSDILTKFVKTTLENIIMDMRDGTTRQTLEKESSSYLLRTTSSIIAENAIKKVIDKVKEDLANSLTGPDGKLAGKTAVEKAAGKVLNDQIKTTLTFGSSNERLASVSRHSSTVSSKGVEDLVLETLHNIVSNLRLEQTMKAQGNKKEDDIDSQASEEINDFVLQTLQNIVTDLQDRRSQIDLGVYNGINDGNERTMTELMSKESMQATNYVNEILHTVLQDMRSEMSTRSSTSPHGVQDVELISPLQLESSIIDTLIKVLSGTSIQTQESLLEQQQRDNVKLILAESIKQTILHVKDGRFEHSELSAMYESLSKCLDERTRKSIEEKSTMNVQNKVMSLLLGLSNKIDSINITETMLGKLSSHLGAIGMDVPAEGDSTLTDGASSSVASSEISDLIQDVISRIKQQLYEESQQFDSGGEAIQDGVEQEQDSEHPNVVDKNFNRRNSATSSCPSTLLKENSDTSSTSLDVKVPKRKSELVSTSLPLDDHNRKGKESDLPVARNEKRSSVDNKGIQSPALKEKRESRLLNRKAMPKPALRNGQGISLTPVVRSCTEATATKTKRDTPIPSLRISRTQEKQVYPKTIKEKTSSSCTPVRPAEHKPRLTGRDKLRSPGLSRRSPDVVMSRRVEEPEAQPEGPVELKSLCGVHRTRVRYRNTQENQSDSTTDDGSFTSELF